MKTYLLPLLEACRKEGVDIDPALSSAALNGHEAAVSLLLAAGANKNAAKQAGWATPLHIAAQEGHEAVVTVLLAASAVL
jgi:ankyrin repeat protein